MNYKIFASGISKLKSFSLVTWIMICILLLNGVALAVGIVITVLGPTGEYNRTVNFFDEVNITTDNTANLCYVEFGYTTGSYAGQVSGNYTMINSSLTAWGYDTTAFDFISDASMNYTYYCRDSSSDAEWNKTQGTWSMETNYNFTVALNRTNNSVIENGWFILGVTLNKDAQDVIANIGSNVGTTVAYSSFSNSSETYWWKNISNIAQEGKKGADGVWNVTVSVQDQGISAEWDSNITLNFTYDSTSPVIASESVNYTTSGHLNYTFKVTETNFEACSVRVIQIAGAQGATTNYTKEYNTTSLRNTDACEVNVTGLDMPDGQYSFEPRAYDKAGNTDINSNKTHWVLNHLDLVNVGDYTFLGAVANESTSEFIGRNDYLRKVSVYNNTDGTWTTHTKGYSTNTQIGINYSTGFYVSVEQKTQMFRKIKASAITVNLTLTMGSGKGWNAIGFQNASMKVYSVAYSALANTTVIPRRVSILNASSSTPHRSFSRLSGTDFNLTYSAQDVDLQRGQGIWMSYNYSYGFANASTYLPHLFGNTDLGSTNTTHIGVHGN